MPVESIQVSDYITYLYYNNPSPRNQFGSARVDLLYFPIWNHIQKYWIWKVGYSWNVVHGRTFDKKRGKSHQWLCAVYVCHRSVRSWSTKMFIKHSSAPDEICLIDWFFSLFFSIIFNTFPIHIPVAKKKGNKYNLLLKIFSLDLNYSFENLIYHQIFPLLWIFLRFLLVYNKSFHSTNFTYICMFLIISFYSIWNLFQ